LFLKVILWGTIMPIIFRCEHCNQKLSIASRKAGDTVDCPSCRNPLLVPLASDEAVAKESPTPDTPDEQAEESLAPKHGEPAEYEEEELIFRKAETPHDEMDLTPMVDVTFLLLIFFMITASFTIQSKFNMPKPDPDDSASTQTVDPKELDQVAVNVNIDEKNEITIDDEPVSDLSRLGEIIERQMSLERKSQLMLTVHAKSLHEYTIRVVDAAKGAGIQKINYAMTGSLETQ